VNLTLLYNLNFTEVYINLEKMILISLTLCKIGLFEVIRVEGARSSYNMLRGGGCKL
jgi:hypothetical protein